MMERRLFTPWRVSLALIFVLSILFYWPSLQGYPVWEDSLLISGAAVGGGTLKGAIVQPFLGGGYFRPLTSVSFVLDSGYSHGAYFFYHQTNILLHSFTALTVCWLTWLVTRRRIAGVVAGLFFVVQPLQTGAVAWMGGRTDCLSSLFLALFAATLVSYYRSERWRWLLASSFCFLLAALSKEQAVAALPLVPLSAFAFGTSRWRQAGLVSLPFLVAVAIFTDLYLLYGPAAMTGRVEVVDLVRVALLTAADYGIAFLLPSRGSEVTFTLHPFVQGGWLFLGLILAVGAAWLTVSLLKRKPGLGWICVGFICLYAPVSNFIPVASFVVAPYRMAEAGTFLSCLCGAAVASAWQQKQYPLLAAAVVNLLLSVSVSRWAIQAWTTNTAITTAMHETDPHFLEGECAYIKTLLEDQKLDEAAADNQKLATWVFGTRDWERLIEKRGQGIYSSGVIARLHSNFGRPDRMQLVQIFGSYLSTLQKMKKSREAEVVARDGLAVVPTDPVLNFVYGNLVRDSNRREAMEHWRIALAEAPDYAFCQAALAHEYVKDLRFRAAVELLEPALAQVSWNQTAWIDIAEAEYGVGNVNEGLAALNRAESSPGPPDELKVIQTLRIRYQESSVKVVIR